MTPRQQILTSFDEVSGLVKVYPIKCNDIQLEEIMEPFQCPIKSFPCKYLGLPLHFHQVRRVEYVQPLIDKVAQKLPTWKRRLLDKAGRLKLMNSVLTSVPTYYLTVFEVKKWAIKQIDKLCRNFLWKGAMEAIIWSGGRNC